MTPEELTIIEARASAASEGPWYFDEDCSMFSGPFNIESGFEKTIVSKAYHPDHHSDLKFIAHAREDIPMLIHEIKRLRAALEEIAKPRPDDEVPDLTLGHEECAEMWMTIARKRRNIALGALNPKEQV